MKRWKSWEWGSKASKNNEKLWVWHNKMNKYFENNWVCIWKQKNYKKSPQILYKEWDNVMIPWYVYNWFWCKYDYWWIIKNTKITKSWNNVLYYVFAWCWKEKRIPQNALKLYESRFSRFTFKENNEQQR